MFGLRWGELLIIFAVILLIFGAARLPQLAKAMGESLKSFKKGVAETGDDEKKPADEKKA